MTIKEIKDKLEIAVLLDKNINDITKEKKEKSIELVLEDLKNNFKLINIRSLYIQYLGSELVPFTTSKTSFFKEYNFKIFINTVIEYNFTIAKIVEKNNI